jgi:hypothetical protein
MTLFTGKKFSELLFYETCNTRWLAQTIFVFPVPALVLQLCYFTRWKSCHKQSIQYRDTRVAPAILKSLLSGCHRWLKGIDVLNEMPSAISDTKHSDIRCLHILFHISVSSIIAFFLLVLLHCSKTSVHHLLLPPHFGNMCQLILTIHTANRWNPRNRSESIDNKPPKRGHALYLLATYGNYGGLGFVKGRGLEKSDWGKPGTSRRRGDQNRKTGVERKLENISRRLKKLRVGVPSTLSVISGPYDAVLFFNEMKHRVLLTVRKEYSKVQLDPMSAPFTSCFCVFHVTFVWEISSFNFSR